ncbi:hypothetical protein [Citrobacter portucalensis]|uniref:hypothetical protein n=1 Tax=Citrobacter portucalensis TaxID=1639133 RepID=UPI00226B32CB|nr:hypothetical protein [Citrobacter portucalensis]MCX9049397.1 hypothetical protein [Citrobacter portucalensis]
MTENSAAERESVVPAELPEYQQVLLRRINNIAVSLMPEFEDKNKAMDALILDDGSLLQLLCAIQLKQKTRATD